MMEEARCGTDNVARCHIALIGYCEFIFRVKMQRSLRTFVHRAYIFLNIRVFPKCMKIYYHAKVNQYHT